MKTLPTTRLIALMRHFITLWSTCQTRFIWILYVDGLKVQLHSGKGKDGLRFMVVAAEAAQQTGAFGSRSTLLVVGFYIPEQV